MPDLFTLLPALEPVSHPLVKDRRIIAVGVSAVLYDERAFLFEVARPRHWGRTPDGFPIVGVGGIGGRIKPGESLLDCLRREIREEIGATLLLEPCQRTALVRDGEFVAWLDLPRTEGQTAPYVINLLPPQLERPDRPDHLAIVTYRGLLQGQPRRDDLFGLLTIEREMVSRFFKQGEWQLEEALALPGLAFDLEYQPPADSVLRPTLTGRSFQAMLEQGFGPGWWT